MRHSWAALLALLLLGCGSDRKAEQRLAALEEENAKLKKSVDDLAARSNGPATSSTWTEAPPAPAPAKTEAAPATRPPDWSLESVASRVTESNPSWSMYSWTLRIRNGSDQPLTFDAKVIFRDQEGLTADSADAPGLTVAPRSVQEFSGEKQIDAAVASSIVKTTADVKPRS